MRRVPAWLIFTMTALIVILAGSYLAREGDLLAERTGLGARWVGAILVAGATSLPEVVTGVSAIHQGDRDLAVGDLFGSSMANMAILAVADILTRQSRLPRNAALTQGVIAALAIGLTATAAIGILSADHPALLRVGWAVLLVAVGYGLGMRMVHRRRERHESSAEAPRPAQPRRLRGPIIRFSIAAVAVLAAAPFLASSGSQLAAQWGIASGFFGVLFLALATSLPEATVVVAAMKAGSHDLAVGNLLGSNCFNMAVLAVLDVADGSGALLGRVEPGIALGALAAILLMGLVLLDMLNRPEGRGRTFETGPAVRLIVYVGGLLLTYRATH
ncbi:MAG: sodium:calcium antiporter [Vicinamibacterales bacterium]